MTTKLETARKLHDYDHSFLSDEGVAFFAKAFGLEGKIMPDRIEASPNDPKGLTLYDGATSAVGMDETELAELICRHLGVKYEPKLGRGSQLRACADALEKHFEEEER